MPSRISACLTRRLGSTLIALVITTLGALPAAAQTVQYVDISPPELANAVNFGGANSRGDFCYWAYDAGLGRSRYYVYLTVPSQGLSAGLHELTDIGPFNNVFLKGIGEDGTVVGTYYEDDGAGGAMPRGARWVGGVLMPIGADPTWPTSAQAIAANATVLGQVSHLVPPDTLSTVPFAATSTGAAFTELTPTLDTCSGGQRGTIGWEINSNGQVLGLQVCLNEWAIWPGPNPVALVPNFALITTGFYKGSAFNSAHQILGQVSLTTGGPAISHGILHNGTYTDMPSLGSPGDNYPFVITDSGRVGGSETIMEGTRAVPHGTLYLPSDAFGFTAGTYDMNDLCTDPALVGFSTRIKAVVWLFDNGIAVVHVGNKFNSQRIPHILKPMLAGLVVNSTADDPDLNPGDGACLTASGECTMRAAIQESNALTGIDTILFSIPGTGVPSIQVGSELPEVTDTVVIDGASQPTVNQVELSGALMLSGNGLTVSAGGCDIGHLLINDFPGNGLVLLTGGNNSIGNLSIGVASDGVTNRANNGHGIFVLNSSNNAIGSAVLSRTNTIAYNGQTGIYIDGGSGNTIRGNRIFANAGLGIDLAPLGVTPNDSADTDAGANGLQNFPVIDSVEVGLVTTIWGTMNGLGGQSYDIDLYLSDSCDPSGYGEGLTLIQSGPVFVGAGDSTSFTMQAVTTPAFGQYITATATDPSGNTSEFSRCVSSHHVRLVDGKNKPIANKQFALGKVANDPPVFTETFVADVTTDTNGIIDLAPYGLLKDDSLKFSRALSSTASPKRATAPQSARTVSVDNAHFDSATSAMSYFARTDDMLQVVTMHHTTVAFNLYVSIEFDATVAYVNNLQEAFRQAANYLYDVTDGQARLDTVFITDNGAGWNDADVWVHASNMEWPRATLNGLLSGTARARFHMPRKFYGNKPDNRNLSALENPLNTATPNSYRTFIHELGHYALGFYDEYLFTDGNGKCAAVGEFGFMQSQYPGGAARSEMSRDSLYTNATCQNTRQYGLLGKSCWGTFSSTYEKDYAGIWASILSPDERTLPAGQIFLLGPNDNLGAPDVSVGAKVVFPSTHSAPGIPPQRYRLIASDGTTPAGNIEVTTEIEASGRQIQQGRTADDGRIYFMGAPSSYVYIASGVSRAVAAARATTANAATAFSWSYGSGTLPPAQDDSIFLAEVQGDLPLVPGLALSTTGFEYSLRPLNPFRVLPSVVTRVDSQVIDSSGFAFDGATYRVTIPDTSSVDFNLEVLATDTAANPYMFTTQVALGDPYEPAPIAYSTGMQADVELHLDSLVGADKKATLTTNYPPLRTGLAPTQLQAGKVTVVAVTPATATFPGTNTLQIRYPEGEISGPGIDSTLEASLRVHHWNNSTGAWELVGGVVDTAQNEAAADITEPGTYALFSTDLSVGVGDQGGADPVRPDGYELYPNYPNPFNPATTLSYRIPEPIEVTLSIYNVLGQNIRTFQLGLQPAGRHSVTWDGTAANGEPAGSGLYLYRLEAGGRSITRKMLLIK